MRTDATRVQELVERMPQRRVCITGMSVLQMKSVLLSGGQSRASLPLEKKELRSEVERFLASQTCPVCQAEHADGDVLVTLPCGHTFHHRCIHRAAQESYDVEKQKSGAWPCPRCPCCRAEMREKAGKKRKCGFPPILSEKG